MNPYEPPRPAPPALAYAQAYQPAGNRTAFILAGVGALAASGYWALLTLLIGLGAATGSVSPLQTILPIVLIALYALRGVQLFKNDPRAAQRILWLHGVGGVVAIMQLAAHATPIFVALQGLKVVIHVFGGVTAFVALRSVTRT